MVLFLYHVSVGERSNFKIFLHTRKIMVMHSNERGEWCLRTNADRLRKRSHNVEEVVVRLPDPTDPSTERTAPPCSAHVQLYDVPRAPIQQSVGDEFRQHDGMVTMMFYRRRASPKHCNGTTEVEFGGRGHLTRLNNVNLCVLGCPLPPYIKEQGGGRPAPWGAPRGRSPPPSRSRTPLFPSPIRKRKGGGRRGKGEGKGGGAPFPSLIRPPPLWGGAPAPCGMVSLPPMAHMVPGGFR